MKEEIDKIIFNFGFEKVHRAMLALSWGWSRTNMKVPPVGALVLCAQELLQEASKMDIGCSISTGGFRATKIGNEDDGKGLKLEFALTGTEYYTKWLDEED